MALGQVDRTDAMQERAVRTRTRVLEAAVEALVDEGYRGATTSRVQALAGVSRGALLHHFPTRADLLLAATAHLAARRGAWLRDRAARLEDHPDRVLAVVGLLWETMNGPLFAAATELWMASRTDEELRTELVRHERELGRHARATIAQALGVDDPADAAFIEAFDLCLQLLRGAALTALLRNDARWERQVVTAAAELFRQHHDGQPTLNQQRQTERPEPT